jgi:hypothetical protein
MGFCDVYEEICEARMGWSGKVFLEGWVVVRTSLQGGGFADVDGGPFDFLR